MNLPNRLLYALFRRLSRLSGRLGPDGSQRVGAAAAAVLLGAYRLSAHRDFIAGNILTAYPDWSRREADALVAAHLRQLMRAIVEVIALPTVTREQLARRIRLENPEHLRGALARGKGVIVLTAHFGNWELMAARLAQEASLSVLVQTPSQGAFDRLFIEHRASHAVATHANSGPASLRPILRALGRNELVGMLIDQHGEAQDAFATMFGQRLSVPAGAFYLARKTQAALLPAFIVRQGAHDHLIALGEPLELLDDNDRMAQAFHDRLEAQIRRHPDHWLWVHDRWARARELRPEPSAPGMIAV